MRELVAILLLLSTFTVEGVTINWGNSLFDSLTQSDGVTPITSAEFTVQIGYFNGITPALANADQWQSSFRVFDSASFNSDIGYFTGSANLSETTRTSDSPFANPATVFPDNAQAHIWISNGGAANQPGTEWALITNPNWTFPTTGQHDQLDWRVSNEGTTTIIGAVTTPVNGPTTIQAATFVVPEPSSSILLLLGFMALFTKREIRNSTTPCV